MNHLTLESVFREILDHVAPGSLSQHDLQMIRIGFGLPPCQAPARDNIIQFQPRAFVALDPKGKPAA